MTENTLCLYYKDQLFKKITDVDSGNYMKNFESNWQSFIVSMQVVNVFAAAVPTVLIVQRKLEIVNCITIDTNA